MLSEQVLFELHPDAEAPLALLNALLDAGFIEDEAWDEYGESPDLRIEDSVLAELFGWGEA